MISTNNFLLVVIFCCCTGVSVTLEIEEPKRLVTLSQIATVVQNYTQMLETKLNQLNESVEFENQTEVINHIEYVLPQFFSFSTSDGKEHLAKVVYNRSKQELKGAQQLQSFVQSHLSSETLDVNIISFTHYASITNNEISPVRSISDIDEKDIAESSFLVEIMPKATGITLENFIKQVETIAPENSQRIFEKIGSFLNIMNYREGFCHGSLHWGNIIVNSNTGAVSLIDWDHCFSKKNEEEIYTDATTLFWNIFACKAVVPIIRDNFPISRLGRTENCLQTLLMYSLKEKRYSLNTIHDKFYVSNIIKAITACTGNIDDSEKEEIFDQRISNLCIFFKPFLHFFTRKYVPVMPQDIQHSEYCSKASILFHQIIANSDLTPSEIEDIANNLNLNKKEWHSFAIDVQ
jgi:hypothetical protein